MPSFIANLVSGALLLFGGLTAEQSNGNVIYWQRLKDFLGDSPSWDPNTVYEGYAAGQQLPDTGVTRQYDFEIARTVLAPDGVQKSMIAINSQFPGPLIEANWGDWIEITVTNSITGPEEGTSLHWHGLLQNGSPWYDGVPGVSQCPIAPGSNFTYRFRADHVGTTWYHSHYSAQLSAGLSGPMVFHGPKSQHYDIDVGPVLLTDWYHTEYETLLKGAMGQVGVDKVPAFSENNLINGKMDFDCSGVADGTPCVSNAGVSRFKFEEGKDHLLRVINGGAAGLEYFSIDEHEMTVITNDFIPIKPYTTNYISLGVGQRADVIVHGKKGADAQRVYWMRNNLSTICHLPKQPYGLAAIYYQDADLAANKTPSSTAQIFTEAQLMCNNELVEPLTAVAAKDPDMTLVIQIEDTVNATDYEVYLLNNQTGRVNYNQPILKVVSENSSEHLDPERNIVNTGDSKVVRIVWENQKVDPTNPSFYNLTFAHPMHLHGHDFQVLSAGTGNWTGEVVNGDNPPRRDTHLLPPGGHLVVQFETDNPGIWPFHCHVAWHVSAGFLVNIMERPQDVVGIDGLPGIMEQTCADWYAWTENNVVDQIDSGLRRLMLEMGR